MHARIQAARDNESGFTLIELLIVIVILGVLAGVVVFSVSGITSRGAKAACEANVASVTVAGEAYYAQTGSYAATVAALVPTYLKTTPTGITYTADNTVTPKTMTVVGNPLCSTLT
jgi:prepilin-type N-terminal cleavage/methylation domain-containing protein